MYFLLNRQDAKTRRYAMARPSFAFVKTSVHQNDSRLTIHDSRPNLKPHTTYPYSLLTIPSKSFSKLAFGVSTIRPNSFLPDSMMIVGTSVIFRTFYSCCGLCLYSSGLLVTMISWTLSLGYPNLSSIL